MQYPPLPPPPHRTPPCDSSFTHTQSPGFSVRSSVSLSQKMGRTGGCGVGGGGVADCVDECLPPCLSPSLSAAPPLVLVRAHACCCYLVPDGGMQNVCGDAVVERCLPVVISPVLTGSRPIRVHVLSSLVFFLFLFFSFFFYLCVFVF